MKYFLQKYKNMEHKIICHNCNIKYFKLKRNSCVKSQFILINLESSSREEEEVQQLKHK